MAIRTAKFRTEDGQIGRVEFSTEGGRKQARLHLENGFRLLAPAELLKKQADGSYLFPVRLEEFTAGAGERAVTVPVIQEELEVSRRKVETGRVRVTKQVEEHQEVVDESVFTEEVEIERIPVNRPVDEAPSPHYEGDTFVLPLVEEVLVVEKRLLLREEIRLHKVRTERRDPQNVTLRKEEVFIHRTRKEDEE